MNIGIDYRLANTSHRGMARYCREIVKQLVKLDKKNNYILFVDSELSEVINKDNVRYVRIRKSNYILGEQVFLPLKIKKEKCDIFWSPYNTFPIAISKKIKLLTTIHDVIFLYDNLGRQSIRQKIGKVYRKLILKLFSKRIDICFTVSEFSKKEILRCLNLHIPIYVTYNCIQHFIGIVQAYKARNPIVTKNYFFTLSGDAPSKNLKLLLELFSHEFKNEILIIGGVRADSPLRLYGNENIQFLREGISDEEMVKFYSESKCFLFFSKYEGFGIPVLEAAACGVPILASNSSSIPEILNDNRNLCTPSYQCIKKIITRFLNQKESYYNTYKDSLSQFSDWQKPATLILSVINNEVGCNNSSK